MSGPKPFKISDLPKMEKKDLTTSDLFLVSDAVDAARNATYTSKGITFGTLSSSIATSVGKSEEVKKDVENTVKTEMTNKIEQYAPI